MKATVDMSASPAFKAWLVLHGGKQDGRLYNLDKETITIGKDPKLSDFVISDKAISREHIRLRRQGGYFVLTDLASLNGTLVNDKQIQTCLLHDGDVVKMGNTTLIYKCVSS